MTERYKRQVSPTPKGKVSEGTRVRGRKVPQRKKSSAKFADDPSEPNRCHAARKSDKTRCRNHVSKGMAVCRYHGGKSTGAPITHGGYSVAIQGKMAAVYEAALANEQMLYNLNETLALSHVILTRAIERAEEADVPAFRRRSLALLDDAFDLGAKNDPEGMARTLKELRGLLVSGVREDTAMNHLVKAVESMATRKKESWDVKLKAAHAINERDLQLIMARILSITIETLGQDSAKRLAQELSREGF